jgi:hypothetical protein
MKKKYHKSDTFTFSQLKERLLVDGQVELLMGLKKPFKDGATH